MPSGDVSVSLWESPTQPLLEQWLDEVLAQTEPGLTSTCHEVEVRPNPFCQILVVLRTARNEICRKILATEFQSYLLKLELLKRYVFRQRQVYNGKKRNVF